LTGQLPVEFSYQ